MKLIGLHGKARSGKDTVANYLIKKYNLLRYGPSVRVKDTTAVMFDVPREYLDDETKKDTVDPFWGITYRQMMQKVGKESSRDVFGDDIWMRHVEKELNKRKKDRDLCRDPTRSHFEAILPDGRRWSHYDGIVLADVRYESEVDWIQRHGGRVYFIYRSNTPKIGGYEGHEGEKGLSSDLADGLLYNNGTIEELYNNVDKQLELLKGQWT